MGNTNGQYTYFAEKVNQYKRPENGLVGLFTLGTRNIFGGDKVTFDIVKRARTLPEPKTKNGPYTTVETDKYGNREYAPPAFKERTNYSIGQVDGRQAGTTIYDDVEKTRLLADKTAEDTALLLDRIEFAMILQACELLQYGKIRYESVYGYQVPDVDMFAPAAHFATVSTLWDGGAGDPIQDIEDHIRLINTSGRVRVDNIVFGRIAFADFLKNARVQTELDNRRIDRGAILFENVQLNGLARVGIFSFAGVAVALWTYDEYYETVDDNGDVTATTDFIDPTRVVFFSSKGDYQRYFAGVDVVKTVPQDMAGFLDTPNITVIGDRVATAFYIDTKEISDGTNEGVYLRVNSKPLLVTRTNDTYGCLKVSTDP